jgi:hypothetical protein
MFFPNRRLRSAVLAGTFGAVLSLGAAVSSAADATPQEMADQLKALQAKVDQMQAKQDALDQANAKATANRVAGDATKHDDKLLDVEGVSAGYSNKRFFIGSDDGNFVLKPWIHIQARYTLNYREDFKHGGTDSDTEDGFEIRRARLGFDGNLFSKDFTYFINWATNRQNSTLTVKNSAGATVGTTTAPVGGAPILEEAWMKYRFHDTPYYFKVGQMHDPLDHENIVGSKYRAPEASLQGDLFGNVDTFTQAATFIYDNKEAVRFEGGITDGIRAANTNFQDFPNNGIAYDGGLAGRVEYKVMGDWKDYDQLTSLGDKKDLLVLGSGVDYSYSGSRYQLNHTLDVQYASPTGWFLYACYFGRYTQNQQGIPNTSTASASFGGSPSDLGRNTYEPSIDVMVSYLINGNIEPFGRFEYLRLAGTPAGSQNNVTDISAGFNYYFYGHNLKFTGMITYLPTGIPISDDGSDILISNNKGEFVVLSQLQLLL